jgi:hypothetical protein
MSEEPSFHSAAIPSSAIFKPPPSSDWEATLIAGGGWSYVLRPARGSEPNAFHRFMQRLCFGIKWRKHVSQGSSNG